MRVTRWRPLIRRSKLEAFLRTQAENCERDGLTQAAHALRQMAENLRMGMSLSVPVVSPEVPT